MEEIHWLKNHTTVSWFWNNRIFPKHVKTCQRGIPEYNIWFFREVTQCDHAFILQYLAYVFRVWFLYLIPWLGSMFEFYFDSMFDFSVWSHCLIPLFDSYIHFHCLIFNFEKKLKILAQIKNQAEIHSWYPILKMCSDPNYYTTIVARLCRLRVITSSFAYRIVCVLFDWPK